MKTPNSCFPMLSYLTTMISSIQHCQSFWEDIYTEYLGDQNNKQSRADQRTEYLISFPAEMKYCEKITEKLWEKKEFGLFMEPVRWSPFYLPDYGAVISEPRDFGTIHDQIKDGELNTYGDFIKDVRLVSANALLKQHDLSHGNLHDT